MKYATPKTVKELELLFEFCPPQTLREGVTKVFFQYMAASGEQNSSKHSKEIIEDFYFLIHFLEEVEKNKKV